LTPDQTPDLADPSINIDRCYCEQKPFAELLSLARNENLSLLELSRRTGCGTHCGWCIAYLRRALQTGETSFHYLLPKEELPHDDEPDNALV
jgi:bacterioferritin-associated ferredoxin